MGVYISITYNDGTLCHQGIKGQKWGVRRFQNEDRTWTEAGKERYGEGGNAVSNKKKSPVQAVKSAATKTKDTLTNAKDKLESAKDKVSTMVDSAKDKAASAKEKLTSKWDGLSDEQKERLKTAGKVAAIAGITAIGVYVAGKATVKATKTAAYMKTVKQGAKEHANLRTAAEGMGIDRLYGMKGTLSKEQNEHILKRYDSKVNDTISEWATVNSRTFKSSVNTLLGKPVLNGKKAVNNLFESEVYVDALNTIGTKEENDRFMYKGLPYLSGKEAWKRYMKRDY